MAKLISPLIRRQVPKQTIDAMEKLPEAQRVVVHLHRFEGLTFGEIAKVLGANESAVRVRAFRAYEVLRNALRDTALPTETP
mgnify:CR=1 FL=1